MLAKFYSEGTIIIAFLERAKILQLQMTLIKSRHLTIERRKASHLVCQHMTVYFVA